ncbi:MAG TPA: M3 family metallopeptidase, partial [Hyphomicrobiaceae bacterium]|nr:M3 family metallopeptidase [Hyphomicrobiaceae bacterium]
MTGRTNPLLAPFDTTFALPPFDKVTSADYGPALDAGCRAHRIEIDAIADNPAAPTFDNTILAMERSGDLLDRVARTFWNLTGANTDETLQATEREAAPKMAEHWNAISSNAKLFARIDDLYRRRTSLGLDAEQLRLLERTHLGFVRAGAALDEAGKKRMAEIMQRLATLGTEFSQNVLADEKAFVLPLETDADRDGLPAFLLAAAASAAKERNHTASHVITLSRSLIEPFLTFSKRRDLREKAFAAWVKRGENGGATDNRAIVAETLKLRAERARLLGYESFAAYKLDDSMAKTPARVRELLETVWEPARTQAMRERDRLAEAARTEGANIAIEPWDWRYYAEKVRAADYGLDEAEIKSYLPLDRIIEAAFATANRLFGLNFTEVKGLALYHPDVRAFEVTDRAGRHVGVFLGD